MSAAALPHGCGQAMLQRAPVSISNRIKFSQCHKFESILQLADTSKTLKTGNSSSFSSKETLWEVLERVHFFAKRLSLLHVRWVELRFTALVCALHISDKQRSRVFAR